MLLFEAIKLRSAPGLNKYENVAKKMAQSALDSFPLLQYIIQKQIIARR